MTILGGLLGAYCLFMWIYVGFVFQENFEPRTIPLWNVLFNIFVSPLTFPKFIWDEHRESQKVVDTCSGLLDGWADLVGQELPCETLEEFRTYLRSPDVRKRILEAPEGVLELSGPLEINCSGCVIDMSKLVISTSHIPAIVISGMKNFIMDTSIEYPEYMDDAVRDRSPLSYPEDTVRGFVESAPNSLTLIASLSVSVKEPHASTTL